VARRLARLTPALAACILLAGQAPRAFAQVSLDEPPLDEHDAKRVDRMEKALRELRAIVFQGRETGQPVVVQPADTEGQINHLSDHLNDIDQTLAKLNGELEVVRHDLDQSHHEVEDLRSANAALKEEVAGLEKTVQTLSAPPPPPPAAAAPAPDQSAAASPPPADPAAQFAAARAALEQGDMATAEAGFRGYIDQAGDGPRGPEARYDLARTLISRHAWAEAATADIGAIRGWPHTTWAPAAVLDLSRALVALDKTQDACETLGELGRRYPKAPPAVLRDAAHLRVQAQCAA
jgi:TolA-binding protein